MTLITFLAYEGCMYSGALGMKDTFQIANLWARTLKGHDYKDVFSFETAAVDGKQVKTDGNLIIEPDVSLAGANASQVIIIPAFLPQIAPLPTDINPILVWLKKRHKAKSIIASLCTSTFILAMTGLLNNRVATTNWQYTKSLKRQFPKIIVKPEKLITEDNGLICSGAATALFSLGLYLIERFGSKELSALTAKSMLIDPNRNSQMPYTVFDLDSHHKDLEIAKAQHWMDANHSRNITITQAADYVGISPRHFKRRFKKATSETPLSYLQKIRVESAKKMLERTNMNINEITTKVGYEDSSTFRRLFKKYVALSPREYRDKFSCVQ